MGMQAEMMFGAQMGGPPQIAAIMPAPGQGGMMGGMGGPMGGMPPMDSGFGGPMMSKQNF